MDSVMDCAKVQEQMLDQMGNTFPSTDLSAHMAGCADCTKLWQAMQVSSAVLDEWKAPEPSPYFDTRFQARLAEVKREEANAPSGAFAWLTRGFLRPALAGVLTLAIAVGVGLYQRNVSSLNTGGNVATQASPAVNDLQKLDKDEDLYADFEMLDDLQPDQQQATPAGTTSGSKSEL